jgi:hypothetical protein
VAGWASEGLSFAALALRVYGQGVPMLLSAEHGAHRVYAEGESFEVKVRFQPGKVEPLDQGEALERALPGTEVRRVWPTRKGQPHGLVKDLRTESEHPVEGPFELGPLLAAWVCLAVFGPQEAPWS